MSQKSPENKKTGFRLSDRQLLWLKRAAKFSALWCASGVIWWGALVAAGGVALGLHALGVAVPHFLGPSSIITGTVMAVKSVVFERLSHVLHRKCTKAEEMRAIEKATANVLSKEGPENTLRPIVSSSAPGLSDVERADVAMADIAMTGAAAAPADGVLRQSFNPYAGLALVLVQEPAKAAVPNFKFAPYRRPGIAFPHA